MNRIPTLFRDEQRAGDALSHRHGDVLSQVLSLWKLYHPYADTSFVQEMRRAVDGLHRNAPPGPGRDKSYYDFHQRWWEMYLACVLLHQGIELVPHTTWSASWGTTGPDLLANVNGDRVWVECVAPLGGTGPDAVPAISDEPGVQLTNLPVELIQLRFLNALDVKRKQREAHLKVGVVQPTDGYVIALNSRCVPWGFLSDDPPLIAGVLYGFGSFAAKFLSNPGEWSDPFLTPRPVIGKASGEPIDANLFGGSKVRGVGGIIYSSVDAWNVGGDPSSSVLFVHNQTAHVPLPDRWLPRSVSYSIVTTGMVGTITKTDPEKREGGAPTQVGH